MGNKRILFWVTEDWYFCSHRLVLARAAQQAGYQIIVVTQINNHGEIIKKEGFKTINLNIRRGGINPLSDVLALIKFAKICKQHKPDIVHNVSMKPVVMGSLGAWIAGIPYVVNALAGMGYLFISQNRIVQTLKKFVIFSLRILCKRSSTRLVLQNPDDVQLMCDNKIIDKDKIELIRGSGVDIEEFIYTHENKGIPIVILASRLLWDKGVGEFVKAAQILKSEKINARFALVGEVDPYNPASIKKKQIDRWKREKIVEIWGKRNDMPEVFKQSHIVCLPSYREGLPKVLIEAAASGRAIVTSDAPGCREIVLHGINGYLVPIRAAKGLAESIKKLVHLPDLRKTMGKNGRLLVEKYFTCEIINRKTISVYKELLQLNDT